MPIQNPSFEDAGTEPGLAAHWTLETFVARERIAGFGPPPHRGCEDFERWFGWRNALDASAVLVAVFEPLREALESFEGGWDNDLFAWALPEGAIAIGEFTGRPVDDLEVGWSAGPFLERWADAASTRGRFDGESAEDFEESWRRNEGFGWRWADVTGRAAVFDGVSAETFEGVWPEVRI